MQQQAGQLNYAQQNLSRNAMISIPHSAPNYKADYIGAPYSTTGATSSKPQLSSTTHLPSSIGLSSSPHILSSESSTVGGTVSSSTEGTFNTKDTLVSKQYQPVPFIPNNPNVSKSGVEQYNELSRNDGYNNITSLSHPNIGLGGISQQPQIFNSNQTQQVNNMSGSIASTTTLPNGYSGMNSPENVSFPQINSTPNYPNLIQCGNTPYPGKHSLDHRDELASQNTVQSRPPVNPHYGSHFPSSQFPQQQNPYPVPAPFQTQHYAPSQDPNYLLNQSKGIHSVPQYSSSLQYTNQNKSIFNEKQTHQTPIGTNQGQSQPPTISTGSLPHQPNIETTKINYPIVQDDKQLKLSDIQSNVLPQQLYNQSSNSQHNFSDFKEKSNYLPSEGTRFPPYVSGSTPYASQPSLKSQMGVTHDGAIYSAANDSKNTQYINQSQFKTINPDYGDTTKNNAFRLQQQQQQQQHSNVEQKTISTPTQFPPTDQSHKQSSNNVAVNYDRQPYEGRTKVETLIQSTNSRIDPAFVPRPLTATEPISQPGGKRYETDKYAIPPSPSGIYTIIDRGNASCRFMRMSFNQLPSSSNTLLSSGIPFVTVTQPFPILGEYEEPIPVINLNKTGSTTPDGSDIEGPLRCTRCHAYVSPFMSLSDDHSGACNFCGYQFRIPQNYQYALAESSRNCIDHHTDSNSNLISSQRPELLYGTVDYVAPRAFLNIISPANNHLRKSTHSIQTRSQSHLGTPISFTPDGNDPMVTAAPAPAFCFVIDTSASAQQSGFVTAAIAAIRYTLDITSFSDLTDVCIITYDERIHFYPMPSQHETQDPQQVLVVTDIDDPFFPASSTELLINVNSRKQQLLQLLNSLPRLICEEGSTILNSTLINSPSAPTPLTRTQSCGNAALAAAVSLLASRGSGAVKIFYGSFPDIGVGSWDKLTLSSTTKEAQTAHLFPSSDTAPFYSSLVANCINNGVSVDVFAASLPNRYMAIGTSSYISRKTGGLCHYYNHFDNKKDYTRVCLDLSSQFQLSMGFDCIYKLRCSRGFSVHKVLSAPSLGKKDTKIDTFIDPSTFRIPRIDSNAAFLFEFKHDGDMPESTRTAYVQSACLHTTLDGYRRVRVTTLAIPITNSLSATFRYSEVECVLAYYVRNAAHSIITGQNASWKEDLIKQIVEILFSYRLNCAANSSSGQLILPDALKSLPVYISGLFKHPAFRASSEVYTDEKDFLLGRLLNLPLHQLMLWIYPKLYVFHRSYTTIKGEKLQRIGTPTGVGDTVYLPTLLPCSGEKITSDGLFLLDNGIQLLFYVGVDVDPEILMEVFGVSQLTTDNAMAINLEELQGPLGSQINASIKQIRHDKDIMYPWQPLCLVRPRSLEESHLLWHLIEDRLGSEIGYVDFLCQLHRAVHVRMEDS